MAAGHTEASTSKPASDTEGEMSEQPEASLSARRDLTDDQLMEVFKQTSIFNVKSALANNQNLMQNETAEDQQQEFFSDSDISDTEEWDYLRGFWSGKDPAVLAPLPTYIPSLPLPSPCLPKAHYLHPFSSAYPAPVPFCFLLEAVSISPNLLLTAAVKLEPLLLQLVILHNRWLHIARPVLSSIFATLLF